jgi:hypothetical protein
MMLNIFINVMNHLVAYICVIYKIIFTQYIVTSVVALSYVKVGLGSTLLIELEVYHSSLWNSVH